MISADYNWLKTGKNTVIPKERRVKLSCVFEPQKVITRYLLVTLLTKNIN